MSLELGLTNDDAELAGDAAAAAVEKAMAKGGALERASFYADAAAKAAVLATRDGRTSTEINEAAETVLGVNSSGRGDGVALVVLLPAILVALCVAAIHAAQGAGDASPVLIATSSSSLSLPGLPRAADSGAAGPAQAAPPLDNKLSLSKQFLNMSS